MKNRLSLFISIFFVALVLSVSLVRLFVPAGEVFNSRDLGASLHESETENLFDQPLDTPY